MTSKAGNGDAPAYGIAPPGYRLPADTHIGAIRLQVSELERSVRFYEDVLGFRAQRSAQDTAYLSAGDDGHTLIALVERPGARPVPPGGRLGLYHFAILLPDRATLGRFIAHFDSARVPIGAADHLVSEALYLSDPDGLGIEVYADRPRSAWRTRGRELAMASLPLDLPAIVAEAGGAAWTGAPRGTTIGHVHLHVGDIAQADAFYHEALGFDRIVWSYPGALFFSAGGYHHHLGTNIWARGARAAGDDDARLLDWELVLPTAQDVRAAVASLSVAGIEARREPGGTAVADPWGTRLLLVPAHAHGT
jgi:catechol 2,3-dioxygenase